MSNGPQKVTDPIFVNPPPEGPLNNANPLILKERGRTVVLPAFSTVGVLLIPLSIRRFSEFGHVWPK